jgi:hypothetical protein
MGVRVLYCGAHTHPVRRLLQSAYGMGTVRVLPVKTRQLTVVYGRHTGTTQSRFRI